jgi:hypothetical protein
MRRFQAVPRAREGQKVDRAALRPHPVLQALGRVVRGVDHVKDFGEFRLERAAIAVVGVDRGRDRGLIFLDQPGEPLEVGDALGVGGLRRLPIGGALGVEAGLELGGDGDIDGRKSGRVHGLCLLRGRSAAPPGTGDRARQNPNLRRGSAPSMRRRAFAPAIPILAAQHERGL